MGFGRTDAMPYWWPSSWMNQLPRESGGKSRMKLARLLSFRHVIYGLIAVAFMLSAVEVGLQMFGDVETDQTAATASTELTSPSWTTHHALKPSVTLPARNPDTTEPVVIRINSFGLRGPEIAVPKPEDTYRVVLLGDETIFGAGVSEQSTVSSLLSKYLRPRAGMKLEVINAGTPGFCPLLSYLQTKHTLLALKPDLFVIHFDMSDVADDYQYRRHTKITQTGDPTICTHPKLLSTSAPKPAWERLAVFRWTRRKMLGRLNSSGSNDTTQIDAPEGRYTWLENTPPDWAVYVTQSFSPLEQFRKLVDGTKSNFVVCTTPVPWQVSATASNGDGIRESFGVGKDEWIQSREPFETLGDFTTKHRILFCDLSSAFMRDQSPDRLYFRNSPDLTAAGHDLCARELARFLNPLVGSQR